MPFYYNLNNVVNLNENKSENEELCDKYIDKTYIVNKGIETICGSRMVHNTNAKLHAIFVIIIYRCRLIVIQNN